MKNLYYSGQAFPCASYTWGDLPPPPYGGTSAGGQSINRGFMRGDIDLMGDLTLIDYIVN